MAKVPSPRSVRMFTEVGRFVMPHCTGVGMAMLSMLTDQQVANVLERTGMPARTEPLIDLAFLAAISVSGPSSRVTMDDVPRIAPDLQAVAADIGREYPSADIQNLLQPNNVMNSS